MRSLFSRFAKSSRRRGVRRRKVFAAQLDGGQSAAALCTSIHLGCDVLERRIVLTASESDFVFSQGTITGYTGAGGVVEIPSVISGKPVVVIGDNAFKNNTAITSVLIPNSVVIVGDFAFYHNTSLKTVTIGNGVTYIGDYAFDSSGYALTSVTIGNHVTRIGDYAFAVSAIEAVVIPNSVKTLGNGVFEACSSLKNVLIPNSVTSIGNSAFKNTGLTTVTMGNRVSSVGSNAFEGNTALKSVKFTAKAPTVGTDAFKGVPFGAKANRAAGLTGYGPNGTLWNNLIVWTPGAVAAPTVTASTANLAQDTGTLTIKGTGFVAGKASAHQVTFNNGAVGTVTAATATRLTVTFLTKPTSTGPLTAIVTSVGGKSGVAKQVATVKITYQEVKVGNPNNANDTGGSKIGAVAYSYQIGTYDVTIGQYAAFLNSVAKTDTYSLYNSDIAIQGNVAGIQQNGSSGSYTYGVVGSPNRPITYVSWFDAARFANWMTNGQGNGSTETGAYTLNGKTSGDAVAANPGAKFHIPTANEWYKAAYYSPTLNGGTGGYYTYATQSNTAPGNQIGGATNQANYYTSVYSVTQSSSYDPNQNYLTDVGAFSGSSSFYGTFDQSGNVYQWNDLDGAAGPSRGLRGGNCYGSAFYVSSSSSYSSYPSDESDSFGFRLASPVAVPEPSTWVMGLMGLACGGWQMFRRRRPKAA